LTKVLVDMDEVLTVAEAAEALNWGVATVWRRIKDGKIVPLRVSGRTLIPKSEIEREKKKKETAFTVS